MSTIFILTIVDGSELDGIVHERAFTSYADCRAYADEIALPKYRKRAGKQWAHTVVAVIREMPFTPPQVDDGK